MHTWKRSTLGVIAEPQSYLNIFYLLLAFPLGMVTEHTHDSTSSRISE